MLTVTTWIKDIMTDDMNLQFKSIDDDASIRLVNQTLLENENDYLEGAIELVMNSETILSREMETADLLLTWQSMAEILFSHGPSDHKYMIELLDSVYLIGLVTEGENLKINVYHYIESHRKKFTGPFSDYKEVVKEGYLKFGDYLLQHPFPFSEESAYFSYMKMYKQLKKLE